MSAGAEDMKLYAGPQWTEESSMTLNVLLGGITPEQVQAEMQNRRDLLERAEQIGLTVVRESITISEDSRDFMAGSKSLPRDQEEAVLRAVVPDIAIPETADFETYDRNPFFPAVAKNHEVDGGLFKYLLERPEQWTAMRKLVVGEPLLEVRAEDLAEYQAVQKQAAAAFRDNPQDSAEYQNWKQHLASWHSYVEASRNPLQGRNFMDFFGYQKFIDTPSDHFSSYRVLTSASGDILASSLYYSDGRASDLQPRVISKPPHELGRGVEGVFEYLLDPQSLAYMAPRSFQSNSSKGGHGVVLDPTEHAKPRTEHDNEVLAAHGLSTEYPELPQKIRAASSVIGRTLGRRLGIVVGIDWIQEKETGTLNYLEINAGPGSVAFAEANYDRYQAASAAEVSRDMHFAALESLVK